MSVAISRFAPMVSAWARSLPAGGASLQALEVGDQRIHVVVAEVQVRHERAGFDGRRILEPAGHVFRSVADDSRRQDGAAADVRQIRTNLALRYTLHGVAADAGAAGKDGPSRGRGASVRRLRRLSLLRLNPLAEVSLRLDHRDHAHVGVGRAAVLRALSWRGTDVPRRPPQLVDVIRDDVAFATQARQPEAVLH